jgi:23S rRNA (cytidine1920-2'-O)/16S rRNA (cytidine1409-2'-O)-methyltransferase
MMHRSAIRRNRLDIILVDQGLCGSREQAKRQIMAGQVRVNNEPARKPGQSVHPGDEVSIEKGPQYVSRGGQKLRHALEQFQLNVAQIVALDLGASTGGFTDCLLQAGASKVFAVDVGSGQLAWKLRQDPRVVVMEKTNARSLSPAQFPTPFSAPDLIVIDCSFISLRKILPVSAKLLRPGGQVVALIKPQFEAGKLEADKGHGVIRDAAIHERIINDLKAFAEGLAELEWKRVVESSLLGPAGNKEFLVLLEKPEKRN